MPALESPFDPLARLEPGEDRFVIREKDPAGPAAITEWARIRRNLAVKRFGTAPVGEAKRMLEAELAQCNEADAKAMDWKERQDGHAPAEAETTFYSGATLTEEQVAAAKRQKNQAALAQSLRDAAYYACEIIEADGPGVDPALVEQHAAINEIANAVEFGAREAKAA